MIRNIGNHGPHNTEFIDDLRRMRKQLADFDPVLSISLEAERGLHQVTGGELGARRLVRQRLPIVFVEQRFVIERVDLGEPALQEDDDHVFRLGSEVRGFGSPGVAHALGTGRGDRREPGHSESGGKLLQSIATRKGRQASSVYHRALLER